MILSTAAVSTLLQTMSNQLTKAAKHGTGKTANALNVHQTGTST